jgi:hypothetical protein
LRVPCDRRPADWVERQPWVIALDENQEALTSEEKTPGVVSTDVEESLREGPIFAGNLIEAVHHEQQTGLRDLNVRETVVAQSAV